MGKDSIKDYEKWLQKQQAELEKIAKEMEKVTRRKKGKR